jgi:hemoglobin
MNEKKVPSLYEWIGGNEKLEPLFKLFYEKVFKDDLLMPVFKNMSPEHIQHVAHFIGEVFGGPKKYTEEDNGSHYKMVEHHIGKNLSEMQRKRWIELLLETADENSVPVDPEFRSALVAYLEWGTRIAVINSQTTENPLDHNTSMPEWNWGVPGGPYQS